MNTQEHDLTLLRNIHTIFSQGNGFGALTTLVDMEFPVSKLEEIDLDSTKGLIQSANLQSKHLLHSFSETLKLLERKPNPETISVSELRKLSEVIFEKVAKQFSINPKNLVWKSAEAPANSSDSISLDREEWNAILEEAFWNACKFGKRQSKIEFGFDSRSHNSTKIFWIKNKIQSFPQKIPKDYKKLLLKPFSHLYPPVETSSLSERFPAGLGLFVIDSLLKKNNAKLDIKISKTMKDERGTSFKLNFYF